MTGRCLVTGAAGFLGSHLVQRLAAIGMDVHAVTRPGGGTTRLDRIKTPLRRWQVDVTDLAGMRECLREVQPVAVFHLAGDTIGRHFVVEWSRVDRAVQVNLVGTLTLLRAVAESGATVETVVRTGGIEEYGTGPLPYREDQREQPRSPYSASQVAATHWCQMLQPQLPFAVVTLRPALTYGPGQSTDFLIPAMITTLLRGERFAMTDGHQGRDLLYVDDLVTAMQAAARPDLRSGLLNIASGHETAISTVAAEVARLLGAESLLDRGARAERPGDLQHQVAATSAAEQVLGWRATTSLRDGLARTVAWYRDHQPIPERG